jgi:hypothetical protein
MPDVVNDIACLISSSEHRMSSRDDSAHTTQRELE